MIKFGSPEVVVFWFLPAIEFSICAKKKEKEKSTIKCEASLVHTTPG